MTDPVNDMFTRIRNALKAKHTKVPIPYSNIKNDVAQILQNEGFIYEFSVKDDKKGFKQIEIALKYKTSGDPEISSIKKVSKSGCQCYVKKSEIPKVLNGYGICILSTSKGIVTGRQARLNNLGGELLAIIH